jgi:hypothetical protein
MAVQHCGGPGTWRWRGAARGRCGFDAVGGAGTALICAADTCRVSVRSVFPAPSAAMEWSKNARSVRGAVEQGYPSVRAVVDTSR